MHPTATRHESSSDTDLATRDFPTHNITCCCNVGGRNAPVDVELLKALVYLLDSLLAVLSESPLRDVGRLLLGKTRSRACGHAARAEGCRAVLPLALKHRRIGATATEELKSCDFMPVTALAPPAATPAGCRQQRPRWAAVQAVQALMT